MPPRDVTGPKRVARRKAAPAGPAGPVGQIGPVAPKRVVRRAPGPPTGLSEQDRQKVRVYHRAVTQAAQQAKHGQPFNATHLRDAIASGVAKGVSEAPGNVFLVKHRRKFLPDDATPVTPEHGQRNFDDPKTRKRVQRVVDTQVMGDPVHAPALKVLEATAYPSHKIAGAFGDKNFGEVLRKAGAPKGLASAGGFALDVAADPTTYVTFGAGSVARHAAENEAAKVAARYASSAERQSAAAVARGAKPAQVDRIVQSVKREGETQATKAAQRVTQSAKPGKGLTVGFGRAQVPGVTRATATGGRVVKRVAAKAPRPVKAAGNIARGLAQDVRPTLRPTGVAEEQFHAIRGAARQTRAQVNRDLARINSEAHSLHAKIGPDNYTKVIDAIERRQIKALPAELKQPAVFLRSRFRHAQKIRRQAGLGEGSIRDYFPHAQHEPLVAGKGVDTSLPPKQVKSTGRIVSYPGSSKQRTLRGPISEVNPKLAAEDRGQFSTDVPFVYANYQRETAKTAASSDFAKRLVAAGRPIKPGKDFALEPGERVYRLGFESSKSSHVVGQTKAGGDVVVRSASGKGRFGLRPLSHDEERALANPDLHHPGQYVALHEGTIEDAARQAAPTQAESQTGRVLDRTTRAFKAVATATPGFHARNAVGDVQMGYLAQPGHRLPVNLYEAGRAVKGLHAQQKAAENLALATEATGKTIKVAGKQMPVEDFLKLAQQHGVTQAGYLTRELADLGGGAIKGVGKATGRLAKVREAAGRARHTVAQTPPVRALIQDRENLVRLATFKHGLDTGLDAERAASLSLGTHIDYGDLTHFERKYARRLMPFYTFSARALPLHVKALVTKPGKFATVEKAREEVGGTDASGYPPYVRRQVPFNVAGKGISDSLPLTLLNEVPTTTSPSQYADELGQFGAGLLSPILKAGPELYANKSLTFRNDIQDPQRPLVAAPSWVAGLPASVRNQLGVVRGPDTRSGKTVWKWPGKVDYAVRQVALGPFNALSQIATVGSGRTGQNQLEKAVAATTGVRITPQDKVTQQINALYDKSNSLTEKQNGLRQQNNPKNGRKISAENPTPEFKRNAAKLKAIDRQIYQLSRKRGDKVLPKRGAPPRPRGGDVGGGFGGFGSGFGSAGF